MAIISYCCTLTQGTLPDSLLILAYSGTSVSVLALTLLLKSFRNVIASAISDIPNVKNISDDVIIYKLNVQEHDKALHAVLTRFQELNLTLRKDKCQFYMPRIEFFGMVFSAQGMSPDPAKVKAIKQADPPTSVSDVRSLLGMTNYVSRFICNYADIVAPLCDLTYKGVEFKWQEVHQKALHQLKCSLTCDAVMAYFDPHNKTALFVDASPVGLGAICRHKVAK